jgi:hypothetical protein
MLSNPGTLGGAITTLAFGLRAVQFDQHRGSTTCDSRVLFQGGDDQKVINFEQILFANGRMLNLTEAPAQRGRAFNSTF